MDLCNRIERFILDNCISNVTVDGPFDKAMKDDSFIQSNICFNLRKQQ